MKTTKFWVLAATIFLLQMAENSNAAQEQLFTYHYTREVGKPRPGILLNEELMLTFSPEAIKKTREYVHSLPYTTKDNLFYIYIGEWHRKRLFENHTEQTIKTDPDVLECIKTFKNKPKVEELPGNRSFEIELYRVNNIQFDRALSEIDVLGKLQNKKVILHIKTTSTGLLNILQYFDNSKEIISNYHALQVIKFIPVRERPFDIKQVQNKISPIEGIQFKFEPYASLKGNSNKLQIAMCIDPNDDTSSFPSSFDFFNEYLSHHAEEYCDTLASIKAKKRNVQEKIDQQIAETLALEKATLAENERIAAEAAEEVLKNANEIEIQRERERIAEEQLLIEQARQKAAKIAAEKDKKEADFWKNEAARQKKQEKKEENAEQALRAAAQAEVDKKRERSAEEQRQIEQARQKLAQDAAEAELQKKRLEEAKKTADLLAEVEKDMTAEAKKLAEKKAALELAERAKKIIEEAQAEIEKKSKADIKTTEEANANNQTFIRKLFSYRPVQTITALGIFVTFYHFLVATEHKDVITSTLTHCWEKLSSYIPTSARFS